MVQIAFMLPKARLPNEYRDEWIQCAKINLFYALVMRVMLSEVSVIS